MVWGGFEKVLRGIGEGASRVDSPLFAGARSAEILFRKGAPVLEEQRPAHSKLVASKGSTDTPMSTWRHPELSKTR